MRIGYYIPGWPPGTVPNGIVTTLGHLGHQLCEMGHEVFFVTPSTNSPTDDPSVTLLTPINLRSLFLKARFKWNFESAYYNTLSSRVADAAYKLVQDKGIQVFQMEETYGWASTVIRQLPIPVVVRLHGPWFLHYALTPTECNKPENQQRSERERRAAFSAAAITAPSLNVLRLFEQHYGELNVPTRVIPNPIPAVPEEMRWNLDACDRDLILFVGRFDYHKGADVLLRTFARLAYDRPTIKLCFVGPDIGLILEAGLRQSFAEFVLQEIPVALHPRIQYRGLLPRSEIDKLRARAYLTVVSSRYETFGNVVVEAMSRGCPIVATDVGGIPEILFHEKNGLITPAGDIDGLAAGISRILDDPGFALTLGQQAARDCANQFEPQKIAQQTIDFYSTLTTRQRESR